MSQPRLIANKGELFDTEWNDVVQAIVYVFGIDNTPVAEYAWYVQPIDPDGKLPSSINIQHREEDSDEVKLIDVPILVSVNGIDGRFLWRAGADSTNRVVGIRYRRRGT